MRASNGNLAALANAVLQPGFVGTVPPDWVRRLLGEGLGSVVLFSRNVVDPEQVSALTAALRAERPEVIVAIDEEAGDVTRIEWVRGSSRPGNLALGMVDDPALTEEVARDLGAELAAAGVTLNYAPDADVNSNPDNPVIGVRSFGADAALVSRHTTAWVRGLQSSGVAACAKHFPGHGDTHVDSHHDLPRITADRARLAAVELAPFRAAVAAGVQAVMTGHLLVPALDPQLPATLSSRILGGLLREELGFQGVVVTDGMEMRAVSGRYGLPGAVVRALAAGADAICVGGEHADEQVVDQLREAIVGAVVSGELPEERLAEAAKRVGQLAAWTVAARTATVDGRNGSVEGRTGSGDGWAEGAGSRVGLAAARRAVRVTHTDGQRTLPLDGAAHVVEFAPPHHLAIGTDTPWGVATPLAELLPGTTGVRYTEEATPADPSAGAAGRPLVLVVRDLHRHSWMRAAVDRALATRPDAVVVELGVPALVTGPVHIATHGATRACGRAAAEVLSGVAGTPGW
ncbi:glycoside hydrolase family 3 protein [Micromonospora sp. NPDC048871]|uniref:glycoside hydrolase family 3 protein n=1 Tax=unclassified Micromonospora TaxID=2617518 RepID=UPI002E10D518|nr:glycoside hydrolase family 3 protein [Micromonospora sp. NBC_01739]